STKGQENIMGSAIMLAQLLLGLVPSILAIAKAIETPGVPGADKAATVTQITIGAVEALPADVTKKLHLDVVESFTQKVLNIAVGFFNKAGIFSRSAPPAPPTA